MRVGKFLGKYNITEDSLKEALKLWSDKNYSSNSKLTEEEFEYLDKYFRREKLKREEAELGGILKGIRLDDSFSFSKSEEDNYPLLFKSYKALITDVELITERSHPYEELSRKELRALLRSKYKGIESIQDSIFENRKKPKVAYYTFADKNSEHLTFPDGGNPFHSSLGDDEEAHTASWNID